jgi:hypothetical protein
MPVLAKVAAALAFGVRVADDTQKGATSPYSMLKRLLRTAKTAPSAKKVIIQAGRMHPKWPKFSYSYFPINPAWGFVIVEQYSLCSPMHPRVRFQTQRRILNAVGSQRIDAAL